MNNLNIDPEMLLRVPGNPWIFWKDLQGTILGCNDIMAEALNLSSRYEIVGKNDFQLPFSSNESIHYRECDNLVLNSRSTKQFYDDVTIQDKKYKFIALKSPLLTQDDKLVGLFGISFRIDTADKLALLSQPALNKFICHSVKDVHLTERETALLQLLVRGKTAKEIAAVLHLSQRTIENYMASLKHKFNVTTKSELIDLIFKEFN